MVGHRLEIDDLSLPSFSHPNNVIYLKQNKKRKKSFIRTLYPNTVRILSGTGKVQSATVQQFAVLKIACLSKLWSTFTGLKVSFFTSSLRQSSTSSSVFSFCVSSKFSALTKKPFTPRVRSPFHLAIFSQSLIVILVSSI